MSGWHNLVLRSPATAFSLKETVCEKKETFRLQEGYFLTDIRVQNERSSF